MTQHQPTPKATPPARPGTSYVFLTWRAALSDAQAGVGIAYAARERMFLAARDAGLSYREIGEATGLSAAGVAKVVGRRPRATLDSTAGSE